MIDRFLILLARHATTVLATGVFVGLMLPPLAAAMRPLLVPSVFVLLCAAFYRLDWGAVAGHVQRPILIAVVAVWLLGIMPIAMWLVVDALGVSPALASALVLMASAPPIISSMPFAQLLRLDVPLAAVAVFVGTLIVPITIPIMALNLLGLEIDIGSLELMLRLVLLAGGAVAVATTLRVAVPAARREPVGRGVDALLVVFMVVFAIAIMDGVTATLLARPAFVFAMIGSAFIANLGLQAVGACVFAALGARQALTVGLINGNRNMALILAALAGSTEYDMLLFFAVGQIPIYVLPALLGPLYRWLCERADRRFSNRE